MNKNTLVVDIGNTNIVCGLYVGMVLESALRIESDQQMTSDEYYLEIRNLGFGIWDVDRVVISSVVPAIGKNFEDLINRYLKVPYIFVNANLDLGLKYIVDDPAFIGADLIVNAFVAWQKYKTNCIVIDFGTATTVQLVGENGTFYGVAILPGMVTAANSLFEKAALLKKLDIKGGRDIPSIGSNTKDALRSGIIKGHAFAVDGFIAEIKTNFEEKKNETDCACSFVCPSEMGERLMNPAFHEGSNIKTIATGGIAPIVVEHTNLIDCIDSNLTLEGLFLIANKLMVT